MPPKRKRSSTFCAFQAKRRKQNQRLDPEKRREEAERQILRRQEASTGATTSSSARCELDSQQRRRQRDAEAHRVARQDEERRSQERIHDAAARRLARADPAREEQQRDTAAHRLAREDPVTRREEQQQDTASHQQARADPLYRALEQQANTARRQQVRASTHPSFRGLNYQPHNFFNTTDVGTLSVECTHCGALKFPQETESLCCLKGNVQLEAFPQPQSFLRHLYEGTNTAGKHFLASIRKYNSAFQMTSFGCNEITMAGFNPSFRVQGQVYHRIGSLVPSTGESPKFSQIYFIDNQQTEVATRCGIVDGLRLDIVRGITELLHDNNHYVQLIKVAKEIFEQHDEPANIRVVINENKRPVGEHARRYNGPMCDEVGVLMPNDNVNNRDIVLHYRDGSLQRISELHRGYDPLQYPLLFSYGTDGWHINLKSANGRKLTAMVYYRYHIMVRQQVPVLLKAKRLFQQFLVDAYCKIETERLQFLRREQKALRADCYQDLRDAMVDGDGDPRNVGRRVILPSSFTGGPRYMHERQQDAMTYVRKYGHPDLFITMTTNPNWPEIRNNLLPGQEPLDRPDLVARVFRLKVKKLLEMLTKEMIFGKPRAWLYSTEWQKGMIIQWEASACYCVVTSGRFYLSFKVALEVTLLMLASSDLICGTVWWLNNYTLT